MQCSVKVAGGVVLPQTETVTGQSELPPSEGPPVTGGIIEGGGEVVLGRDDGSVRLAGREEGDHREDPAVTVVGLREFQLGENAGHMLFDGAL